MSLPHLREHEQQETNPADGIQGVHHPLCYQPWSAGSAHAPGHRHQGGGGGEEVTSPQTQGEQE